MARKIAEENLKEILDVVVRHPGGLSAHLIHSKLGGSGSLRTLQYHLKHLVKRGGLAQEGQARATRYRIADEAGANSLFRQGDRPALSISRAGASIQKYVTQPLQNRRPVGYERTFLDSYRPNESFYLTEPERAHLYEISKPQVAGPPSSIYAGRVLNSLLVDLPRNSCRLEGNPYSMADTRRLVHFGQAAKGRSPNETQMILNHKDAIGFLVAHAATIGINRYTILNLHAMLADNLLADPGSSGRLRQAVVEIKGSSFHPPGGVPQVIGECFDQVLATAGVIRDPYEQAFFVMAQLPYLHPFDGMNKQVSRLSANIPLIKAGLAPLSFVDVPSNLYRQAMLGIYELNRVDLLKDLFIWSCERSAAHLSDTRQSPRTPDPIKLNYPEQLRGLIHTIVCKAMSRESACTYISSLSGDTITADDREAFRECAETELLNLHAGNHARYRIRPDEFRAWQDLWSAGESFQARDNR